MSKQKYINAVKAWLNIAGQHGYETENFSLALHQLTDNDLETLKPVSSNFLLFAPLAINALHPKCRPDARRAVAYLQELQDRQQAAAQKANDKYDRMRIRIAEWLQKNGNR